MTELVIQADQTLMVGLRSLAAEASMSIEELARQALVDYLRRQLASPERRYSFVGVGKSGTPDLSQRAEELLAEANPHEGWSLP